MIVAWVDQLLTYAGAALMQIQESEQYPDLMQWARDEGADLLGQDVPLAQALAPLLWNQTPLVRKHYHCEPLAEPHPSESCWCDSGRTYRQCCERIDLPGIIPSHLMWMLSLCTWRGHVFTQAARSGLAPPNALLEAAAVELDGAKPGRAQQLLEALCDLYLDYKPVEKSGSDIEPNDQSNGHGFDEEEEEWLSLGAERLLELYSLRGFYNKHDALIRRLLESSNNVFNATALEQLVMGDLENDDLYSARQHFEQALRSLPDAPMLAYLETMLLMQEGLLDKARQRALFWFRRLSRLPEVEPEELDFIQKLSRNPVQALASELIDSDSILAESLTKLSDVLKTLPLGLLPSMETSEQGDIVYIPSSKDMGYYQSWLTFTGQMAEIHEFPDQLWFSADDWLPALLKHTEWLQSPLVLRDLGLALTSRFGHLPWMVDYYFTSLASHVENWLTQIERYHAFLPWALGENRLIYLLGISLIASLEKADRPRSRRLAERLYKLDPDDPLDLRPLLIENLLREHRHKEALALSHEVYGDESEASGTHKVMTLLCEALVYYRSGDIENAKGCIREIDRINRYAIPSLVKPNVQSRPSREEPSKGSRDEALNIRFIFRDCWAKTEGALEWLSAIH